MGARTGANKARARDFRSWHTASIRCDAEFLEGLARFRDLYPGSILMESENENVPIHVSVVVYFFELDPLHGATR